MSESFSELVREYARQRVGKQLASDVLARYGQRVDGDVSNITTGRVLEAITEGEQGKKAGAVIELLDADGVDLRHAAPIALLVETFDECQALLREDGFLTREARKAVISDIRDELRELLVDELLSDETLDGLDRMTTTTHTHSRALGEPCI